MNFENYTLENNPIAYKVIKNAFASNKVSHAYLFSSSKDYLIENEPLFLIEKLISVNEKRNPFAYPDLTIIDGSKGLITKEQVTLAIEKLQQTSLDSLGIKILWIKNVENGNSQSLNSLLKFIEEPTKNTYIVQTTNNINQVLSTIRSRSQNISLKTMTRLAFISALQILKVETKKARILASISNNIDEALMFSENKEIDLLISQVINILSKSLIQKSLLFSELSPLLKKDSYKIILAILSAFFNDIWKSKEVIELTFEDERNIVENYANKNFNFEKALFSINDFILKQFSHVNFDLYKNKLMISLEECYE